MRIKKRRGGRIAEEYRKEENRREVKRGQRWREEFWGQERAGVCWFVYAHDAGGRGEELPAVLDVGARPVADHVLDVVIETVGSY